MATFPERFSYINSDPLRAFRFKVTFTPSSHDTDDVFDERIITNKNGTVKQVSKDGKSTGFVGGFVSVSGLSVSVQEITYREGGYNTTPHRVPGMTNFVPVTFQRGTLFGNDQALTWLRGLFGVTHGNGIDPDGAKGYRLNITIDVLDHPKPESNKPRMRFKLHNAWITGLEYSGLAATSNELLFETMTVVHEGMSVWFVDDNGNPLKD